MNMNFFHITWATHNTRTSERMRKYNVRLGKPVLLSEDEETEVAEYVYEIVRKDNLRILAFNICVHHVHMIILCDTNERDNIIQKLKRDSAKKFLRKRRNNLLKGVMTPGSRNIPKHLWAQKYNKTYIFSDKQLTALYNYVVNNRIKHSLPVNEKLDKIIELIVTPYERIFKGIDFGYG